MVHSDCCKWYILTQCVSCEYSHFPEEGLREETETLVIKFHYSGRVIPSPSTYVVCPENQEV